MIRFWYVFVTFHGSSFSFWCFRFFFLCWSLFYVCWSLFVCVGLSFCIDESLLVRVRLFLYVFVTVLMCSSLFKYLSLLIFFVLVSFHVCRSLLMCIGLFWCVFISLYMCWSLFVYVGLFLFVFISFYSRARNSRGLVKAHIQWESYGWVMAHMWTCRNTHTNESCHAHSMGIVWMSHGTHVKAS